MRMSGYLREFTVNTKRRNNIPRCRRTGTRVETPAILTSHKLIERVKREGLLFARGFYFRSRRR